MTDPQLDLSEPTATRAKRSSIIALAVGTTFVAAIAVLILLANTHLFPFNGSSQKATPGITTSVTKTKSGKFKTIVDKRHPGLVLTTIETWSGEFKNWVNHQGAPIVTPAKGQQPTIDLLYQGKAIVNGYGTNNPNDAYSMLQSYRDNALTAKPTSGFACTSYMMQLAHADNAALPWQLAKLFSSGNVYSACNDGAAYGSAQKLNALNQPIIATDQ